MVLVPIRVDVHGPSIGPFLSHLALGGDGLRGFNVDVHIFDFASYRRSI